MENILYLFPKTVQKNQNHIILSEKEAFFENLCQKSGLMIKLSDYKWPLLYIFNERENNYFAVVSFV